MTAVRGSRPEWSISRVSLILSTEIKQRLAPKGVRWLYLRNECKRIVKRRLDMEVFLFGNRVDSIAISHQTAALIPPAFKIQRCEPAVGVYK